MPRLPRILFVCVENAGRSQMAEAFARHYGKDRVVTVSAGTRSARRVHPIVTEALRERGIDTTHYRPKRLSEDMIRAADHVVTMGCSVEQACPAPLIRGKRVEDWALPDPKNQSLAVVRSIRDEIERRVRQLLAGYSLIKNQSSVAGAPPDSTVRGANGEVS